MKNIHLLVSQISKLKEFAAWGDSGIFSKYVILLTHGQMYMLEKNYSSTLSHIVIPSSI